MADKERRSRASMETQIYKQAGRVFTLCYTRTASLPLDPALNDGCPTARHPGTALEEQVAGPATNQRFSNQPGG